MDLQRQRAKTWNTKEAGLLEFLVYPENGRFVGVCLTLDIVEEGGDPNRLMESIREAATGHVLLVVQKNLDDALLNRPAPNEYWQKYFEVLENRVGGKPPRDAFMSEMLLPLNSRTLSHA